MNLATYPDPILNRVARDVRNDELDEVKSLIDEMLNIMYTGDGVGLAAPQVGDSRRFILVDHSAGEDAKALRIMINPKFVSKSDKKELGYEGCLSVPGKRVQVARHASVVVEYFDALTSSRVATLITGFEARIVQHEIDHLDGITLVDK